LTARPPDDNKDCQIRDVFEDGPPLVCVDKSFDEPNMNLAFDEALLDACEDGSGSECLRLWESPVPFVVLGVSQAIREEAALDACEQDGVPVLRRCSAGGAVLQGPGCLNYSVVLRYDLRPGTEALRGSYCAVLGALTQSFAKAGIALTIRGTSDLALGDLKVSGSAQKRRRRAFLHHGTFLYAVQDGAMARYLQEPKLRPEYRGGRPHDAFVTTLPLDPLALRKVVCRAFHATDAPSMPPAQVSNRALELLAAKYDQHSWVYRR
jgi:lipoate-protein ligase A